MKNHAKVGKRPGRPTYRTAAVFRSRQAVKTASLKAAQQRYRKNLKQGKSLTTRELKQRLAGK